MLISVFNVHIVCIHVLNIVYLYTFLSSTYLEFMHEEPFKVMVFWSMSYMCRMWVQTQ